MAFFGCREALNIIGFLLAGSSLTPCLNQTVSSQNQFQTQTPNPQVLLLTTATMFFSCAVLP